MINISLETHLPIVMFNPNTFEPEIRWVDRTTGKCGRIDDIFPWCNDGVMPKQAQYDFEDRFGMTIKEWEEIGKAAMKDPDKDRIKALANEYHRKRLYPLTIQEAKAKLADELRDHPSFRGIGLRGPLIIVVMWADEKNHPAPFYEEYMVEVAITGDAHPL